MRPLRHTLIFCLALHLVAAHAAVTLYDFEQDDNVAAWQLRAGEQDTLARERQFATSGDSSMLYTTPAWEEGMPEWPAFEAKPPVTDWRPFDRLVVDITNPDEGQPFLACFISDSTVPFREGLSYRFELTEQGFSRFVIPLSSFPETLDRADIAIIHFFTQRPENDVRLYLDNIALLAKDEQLPEPPPQFARQIAELGIAALDAAGREVDQARSELLALPTPVASRRWLEGRIEALRAQLQTIRERMLSPGVNLAELADLRDEAISVPAYTERLESVVRLREACAEAGLPHDRALVGFATSMEKVLPRDMPFELTVSRDVSVSLARNEKESFQVAVLPLDEPLERVRVRVSDLRGDDGAVFPSSGVDCDVVGYVETKSRPPYDVPYVGWWPDPILDFLGPVDVAPGDLQAFWVRLRAPKEQAPGSYRGTLSLHAQGMRPLRFGLTVTVRSFSLPDHSPLPTAITFSPPYRQLGGEDQWPQHKFAYADFLADYYIDYDSLYFRGPPDYDIVTRLHDRGQLVAFNLGNVFNAGTTEEGFDAAIADTIARLRPGYEKAKELGLLNHAYIYGFDERPEDQFGLLERSAQALREAFPEVLLMTTSYDHSFGVESDVKTIDAWCPLTPRLDPERADRARAQGRKVWWYICCGPHHPYANWFVEYPAIEARLLMGAMTAKRRPDGFLYYLVTIWNQNEPIQTGPFTEWNPVSWTTYHGDGSLFHCGPGGKPLPSIRLENFRDGLEDFAYACILEATALQYESRATPLGERDRRWLAEARALLAVPATLVNQMDDFSRDPRQLYAWRERMAELIEESGVTDVDPWGDDFDVRGFSAVQ